MVVAAVLFVKVSTFHKKQLILLLDVDMFLYGSLFWEISYRLIAFKKRINTKTKPVKMPKRYFGGVKFH